MGVSRSEPFISWCFIRVKVDNKNILYAVVCLRVHVRTCVSTDAHMQMCKVRRQLCISVLSFVFGIWRSHLGHHQACIAVAAYDIALSIQTQFFSYWVGFGDLLLEVFLFKIYFYFICMCFYLHVCLHCVCVLPVEARRKTGSLGTGSIFPAPTMMFLVGISSSG